MTVEYTAQARFDLLEAVTYYEKQEKGLAADFYREFSKAECDIAEMPEFWHPVKNAKDYRRKHFSRYPYSLVYRIESEELLLVVAIAHSSRPVRYWE